MLPCRRLGGVVVLLLLLALSACLPLRLTRSAAPAAREGPHHCALLNVLDKTLLADGVRHRWWWSRLAPSRNSGLRAKFWASAPVSRHPVTRPHRLLVQFPYREYEFRAGDSCSLDAVAVLHLCEDRNGLTSKLKRRLSRRGANSPCALMNERVANGAKGGPIGPKVGRSKLVYRVS